MKKKLKVILCFIVIISSVISQVPAQAKVNMPASSSELIKSISPYVSEQIAIKAKKKFTKIELNNKMYYRALVESINTYGNKFRFNSEKEIHKLCYDIFGKPGYKDVTKGEYFYYDIHNKIHVMRGDWGAEVTVYKIIQKKKMANSVYDVYVTHFSYTGRLKLVRDGESIIRIKKNNKSSFGYVVKKIKYKTTRKSYFS